MKYKILTYNEKIAKACGFNKYCTLSIINLIGVAPSTAIVAILCEMYEIDILIPFLANGAYFILSIFFVVYTCQICMTKTMTDYVFENDGSLWKIMHGDDYEFGEPKEYNRVINLHNKESITAVKLVEDEKVGIKNWNVFWGGIAKITKYENVMLIKSTKKYSIYRSKSGKRIKIYHIYQSECC